MEKPAIGVVVFDLGGVVVRIARTWRARAIAAGLSVDQAQRGEAALTACWDSVMALQRGECTTEELAEKFCAEAGPIHTVAEVVSALNSQLLGPFTGVAQLVSQLRVPHAIFSNTSADHWAILLNYEVVAKARWRIASFQIGAVKPDPQAFEAFEAATGQPGSRLLFFDDSEQNVRSARACGWHAERIDPFDDVAAQLRGHLSDYSLLKTAE